MFLDKHSHEPIIDVQAINERLYHDVKPLKALKAARIRAAHCYTFTKHCTRLKPMVSISMGRAFTKNTSLQSAHADTTDAQAISLRELLAGVPEHM